MTQTIETGTEHSAHLRQAARGTGASPWIDDLRRRGAQRFEAVGFPTRKTELWRHTNITPIAGTQFEPAAEVEAQPDVIAPFSFGRAAEIELVFINGRFNRPLSRLAPLNAVEVRPLSEVIRDDPKALHERLGTLADIEANPFVALNSAFIQDGAYVELKQGASFEKPVHLLFVTIPGAGPTVTHPRVLIRAEAGVKATIVESYVGAAEGKETPYFTNAVTEVEAQAGAVIDHCRLQQETAQSFHVSTTQVSLAEDADFINHSATLGAKLSRNDLTVGLNGERAHATLNGLVILDGEQHCDNHTLLRHEKANCPSHELYKHILDDKATGVFRGMIFVRQDAQKTDSKQSSKTLLLSDDAYMNSQPALEIYADDVKCTHGSTTGPVDEDMVFYLRTRGVSLEAARHLLTYAFAADITRRIRVEPVRRRLEDYMAAQHDLPQDLRITDLGSHDEAAL